MSDDGAPTDTQTEMRRAEPSDRSLLAGGLRWSSDTGWGPRLALGVTLAAFWWLGEVVGVAVWAVMVLGLVVLPTVGVVVVGYLGLVVVLPANAGLPQIAVGVAGVTVLLLAELLDGPGSIGSLLAFSIAFSGFVAMTVLLNSVGSIPGILVAVFGVFGIVSYYFHWSVQFDLGERELP